jgi:hypothetical protein
MRAGMLMSGALWGLIAFWATGCSASGYEIGGKLGVYAVDEREDSSRTYRARKPLSCMFWHSKGCESGEVRGS